MNRKALEAFSHSVSLVLRAPLRFARAGWESRSRLHLVSFLVAVGVLLTCGVLLNRAVVKNRMNSRMRSHTHEVLYAIQNVIIAVTDAETARRGYVLVVEDRYLTDYTNAVQRLDKSLIALKRITADNPSHQERCAILETLITKRVSLLNSLLGRDVLKLGEFADKQPVKEGTDISKKIREQTDEMIREETSLRQQYLQAARIGIRRLLWMVVLTSFFGVLVLLAVYLLALKEARYRRAAETKVIERNKELQTTYDELELFSFSVSHDLRAPLRAISGNADILEEESKGVLNREAKRALEIIKNETKRTGILIVALLNLAKVNRNQEETTAVDTMAMVRSILNEQFAGNQRCTFELLPLPEVKGVEALLRQVFANLIANAVKFSSPRTEPRVEIGTQEGNEVVFYVRDNGVGFDGRYAKKLFGAFQRLHSDEEFEGSGIGLALVHRIVTRHGGKVWAESKLNEGATFYFTLKR